MNQPQLTDLDELFNRDPLDLSENDIVRICDELRDKRKLWAQEEESARQQGKRVNPNKGMKLPAPKLTDLDITL